MLCYELGDWTFHPALARDFAAFRDAVRVQGRHPVWIEEASVRFAAKRWPELLPVTKDVMRDLGRWSDGAGSFLYRRDAVHSLDVLFEWLVDAYRRRAVAECPRVAKSLHRHVVLGLRTTWLRDWTFRVLHWTRGCVCRAPLGLALCF